MARAKKKKDAFRKYKLKKHIEIRRKMGKPVFFTLTHCCKTLSGISNKYNYKSNMHNLIFTNTVFLNVKYQAAIMTNCNFRKTSFTGVDFYNCNMRGSSFKMASFENVIFFNCNLDKVDFQDAKFKNSFFVCTNMKIAKNLNYDNSGIIILRSYPKLNLSEKLEKDLLSLADNKSIFFAKVLHVNKKKLNNWSLFILQKILGAGGLDRLFKILIQKNEWKNLYTIDSFIKLLDKKKIL